MNGSRDPSWVRRTAQVLRADPSRVVTRIFLPGQEMAAGGQSRSTPVLARVLALSDAQVTTSLAEIMASFGPRHYELGATLDEHAELLAHRFPDPDRLSPERRRLIGAYFTMEYSIEAAAFFNPSMVRHPDQNGLEPGSTRFVMSARAVGEGHVSSVEFRTGVVDEHNEVAFDETGDVATLPVSVPARYSKAGFAGQIREFGGEHANSDFVLAALPEFFARADLDDALAKLRAQGLTRGTGVRTVDRFEAIAASNYSVEFPADSRISQRVLMPRGPSESHGLEDVRLTRFVDHDGRVDYRATYTAYDGRSVVPQLFTTDDFRTFHVSQFSGAGAKNKGMAIFPRMISGEYVSLSRWDRESNAVVTSPDMRNWSDPVNLQSPEQPWEIVQLGNCGPPIETTQGWLVLTHGVGPMRQYGIGALLLDLDDPTKVIGHLDEPLLTPAADERDGYVPNVVYSCGAMLHGDALVLPYGCSDSSIRVAVVDLPSLLRALD